MTKAYDTQATRKIIIPYQPRHYQEEIAAKMAKYRFLVAVCHRRFGKTVVGVMWLILAALSGIEDFRGYYIAPNQKQAKRLVWNYFKKFLSNFGPELVTFNETELRIDFHTSINKPSIYLAGAENIEALRGVYMDAVVMDEMASWEKAEYAFYEVIYPAMSDRNGKGFIIGTVKGLDLFFDLFQMGCDKKTYPDWDSVLYPVTETGVFSAAQIATLKSMMRPDAFAREYMCDFYAEAPDRLISPQEVSDAVNRNVPDTVVRSAAEVWGFDVGYTGDPSKLVKRKGPLLRQIQSLDNKDSVFQAAWLKQQIDRYHPKVLYIDAGYGEGVIAQLNDMGYAHIVFPIFFGSASPVAGCFNMRAYMYWMAYKWLKHGSIPKNDNLIKQLSNVLLDDNDPNRRIKLKPKKEIRAILRMSPDEADAFGLTFAGGDEDMLDLNDIIANPHLSPDEASLRAILQAYASGSGYDPENFADKYSGGNVLEQLDKHIYD